MSSFFLYSRGINVASSIHVNLNGLLSDPATIPPYSSTNIFIVYLTTISSLRRLSLRSPAQFACGWRVAVIETPLGAGRLSSSSRGQSCRFPGRLDYLDAHLGLARPLPRPCVILVPFASLQPANITSLGFAVTLTHDKRSENRYL
jgi:hypothetical protein